jgi:hypothetical protein
MVPRSGIPERVEKFYLAEDHWRHHVEFLEAVADRMFQRWRSKPASLISLNCIASSQRMSARFNPSGFL